jgi:TPR repeat protein
MAKLWLQHPHKLLQPENMTAVLRACVEMRCDGAEMVLADAYLRSDSSSETKRRVMSLYRCAAAYGDVDAQMKLARLLAGKDLGVLDVQVDSEEAERWYLCVCGSEYTSPAQAARANFELAQLFMSNGKYIQAAGHFHRASGYVPEAEYQQLKCERYGEANFFSQGGGVVDE